MNGPGHGESRSWRPAPTLGVALAIVAATMAAFASTTSAQLVYGPCTVGPVLAVFVIDPDVQGIPAATNDAGERVSGVANLNYVIFPLHLEENLVLGLRQLDLESIIVRVGSSVEAAIAAIPDDADAVYVLPLMQLPPGDFDRLGRRIALNMQRILVGEDAGGLPVYFDRRTRLSLNIETVTTVAGLLPLWFGGGPMYEPTAIAMIFGLIFAMLLMLGVVPILYALLFRVSFKGFVY
jgi:hypothetical protein